MAFHRTVIVDGDWCIPLVALINKCGHCYYFYSMVGQAAGLQSQYVLLPLSRRKDRSRRKFIFIRRATNTKSAGFFNTKTRGPCGAVPRPWNGTETVLLAGFCGL